MNGRGPTGVPPLFAMRRALCACRPCKPDAKAVVPENAAMKAAVVTFPGSNCDRDLAVALTAAGAEVARVWHKDTALPQGVDLVAVPGAAMKSTVPPIWQ